MNVLMGIDVSNWQGEIAWRSVRQFGVSFAFIKASEGATYTDPWFERNWAESKKAGIIRSAYHYLRTSSKVADQIDNFINIVGKLESGDLPPVVDVEEPGQWSKLTVRARADWVIDWLEGVKNRLGVAPIIYSSPSFIQSVMSNDERFAHYLLWVAHWTSTSTPLVPRPWTRWTFWQYSSTGSVDGIKGNVDLDRFNGRLDELMHLCL